MVHIPDFAAPFILQTNALKKALGAMLLQQRGEEERPVAFASHKVNSVEGRYAMIEKECLALPWASEYFRYYILGQEFTVVTDHTPLQ